MITQALVANGAKVYITGRREETIEETVKQYNTGPGELHALPGDVSSKDECIRLAEEIKSKESGGIQLLVNNAGIARDTNTKFCMLRIRFCSRVSRLTILADNGRPDASDATSISQFFLKSEEDQWLNTFHTNVAGQYFMSMAFLPLLAAGSKAVSGYSSSIVNVSVCLLWISQRELVQINADYLRIVHLWRHER